MKKIFQSFYGKLSLIFLILLFLMGIVQILVTFDASKSFFSQADQTLNLDLAKNMKPDFEPLLEDGIIMSELAPMLHYMMVINPKIEIYLLDDDGKILAFFAEPDKKVQTENVNLIPIRAFINHEKEFPILGDDPRHPGIQKVFSAAPIKIGKDINGYLYVIIESEQFDYAAQSLQDKFMTSTLVRGLLISLLFTGIIGLILFAVLTKRIRNVDESVKEFEQGKLDKRISVKSSDELGHLANSFNKMADTIVANMNELKKTDKLRRELIANVSHDLRSPLTSIKGYLETIQMKDKELEPFERQKYVDTILNVTNMLERLVEQLFELSKLDARQTEPYFEPFSIADLVQDIVMKFIPVAEKSKINLIANVPEQLPQVYGDIGLIERALSNLIENALRYTPEEGTVKVIITHKDEKLCILVSDTGHGIQEEELPYIFERFYRVDKSRDQATGGSGLGLAIAKKIIEIHESSIKVESKIDVGTTFSFDLSAWRQAYS